MVRSSATNALKMAWIVLLNNAHTRLPFAGVNVFYEALQRGAEGRDLNPIFYVSSSPWNIYDLLEDFLDVHGVPAGHSGGAPPAHRPRRANAIRLRRGRPRSRAAAG